jgi:hypothetical protein
MSDLFRRHVSNCRKSSIKMMTFDHCLTERCSFALLLMQHTTSSGWPSVFGAGMILVCFKLLMRYDS